MAQMQKPRCVDFSVFFFKRGPSRSSKNGSNNDDAILQGFQVSKEVLDCENKFEKMGYPSTKNMTNVKKLKKKVQTIE
jgi:hypothetical protein